MKLIRAARQVGERPATLDTQARSRHLSVLGSGIEGLGEQTRHAVRAKP